MKTNGAGAVRSDEISRRTAPNEALCCRRPSLHRVLNAYVENFKMKGQGDIDVRCEDFSTAPNTFATYGKLGRKKP